MESRGLGDTVEKIMKATGIKKMVETTAKIVGVEDCGCEQRRNLLNEMFPYKKSEDVTDKHTSIEGGSGV